MKITIRPSSRIQGRVELPGDKSISHRLAMLGAIAKGKTVIQGFSSSADCASTLSCLRQLGVGIVSPGPGHVVITGQGLRGLEASERPLDAGNSGSTLRMLSGILAGQHFSTTISGDRSLRRRPMQRIIDPLSQMGAEIQAGQDNTPPLSIRGGDLQAIDYSMPLASAQVKSAILLAGLYASGKTSRQRTTRHSRSYRNSASTIRRRPAGIPEEVADSRGSASAGAGGYRSRRPLLGRVFHCSHSPVAELGNSLPAGGFKPEAPGHGGRSDRDGRRYRRHR